MFKLNKIRIVKPQRRGSEKWLSKITKTKIKIEEARRYNIIFIFIKIYTNC